MPLCYRRPVALARAQLPTEADQPLLPSVYYLSLAACPPPSRRVIRRRQNRIPAVSRSPLCRHQAARHPGFSLCIQPLPPHFFAGSPLIVLLLLTSNAVPPR